MRKFLILAPISLALGLAACSDNAETTEGTASSAEAIAPIDPPAGQQWSTTVAETEDGGVIMGNPEAPIKVVEFMSITCSHCATFGEQAFDSIRDDYVASGRVSFEVRNFVRDPLDLTASILSRCGGEGPFFALTKQALSNQGPMFEKAQAMGEAKYEAILKSPPNERFVKLAEEIGLIEFFQQRGISADQAKACLSDVKSAEKLMTSTEQAVEKYNIAGTPSFLINGNMVDGTNWPVLENKLQQAGAR